MGNKIVQSLWIGDRLSAMERTCINSFIQNGHEYHLYTYGGVFDVPSGVFIKNADEIISRDEIFKLRGGYSSFSDFFRWKLILDKGGWWVDTDAVCLKPFDFDADYVFIGGKGLPGSDDCITSGLFKAPAGSDIMEWGWLMCQYMDPETMTWGAAGPPLFTEGVHNFKMLDKVIPAKWFFPIHYTEMEKFFIANAPELPAEAYSVHMFNEIWRLSGWDKDKSFRPDCLYEKLKRRFA
jgi:hypothetical protein